MKYQKLENLECGWIWEYLIKKYQRGESITKYLEKHEEKMQVQSLQKCKNQPEKIVDWVNLHLNPMLEIKLNQAIRARRKRHFNAEQTFSRKKSIDLEFLVWQRLSNLAKKKKLTLSETIVVLIEQSEYEKKYR